ncbi:MAG: electron transfer flavoprotein subunit beta/FixA family protein [Cyanobacteria bacterium HKST-UBA03]|nr:electron transfer flavoprotein subunit beta/FixA family protein [Cyanobacteria bacterium HKST-UBA03]
MTNSAVKDVFVMIKQVPDTRSKAGLNPDGTINRAQAKRMLNPFDEYALQAALNVKKQTGCRVTAITMGPPPAIEILYTALEHGADRCYLLSDRRLAASDTLATAFALWKTIEHLNGFQMIFCGLQTTDGDTAQVGPQLAERLNLPQVTYCEDFEVVGDKLHARRVVEGGWQRVVSELPVMVTVANSYHPLEFKSLRGARMVQELMRNEALRSEYITTVDLDVVGADPDLTGLKGSPTIVAKTDKVGSIGGNCAMHQGQAVEALVREVTLQTNLLEFAS